jgi:FMN-dependent NADH-azoreductase
MAGPVPSLAGYDTVLLGSPIWNVRRPMIMSTFIDSVDWTGRTIDPFVTYAVSGLGATERIYRQSAAGARAGESLAVRGEPVGHASPHAASWLSALGLA